MKKFIVIAAFLALSGCVDSTGFGIFDDYVGEKECIANGWTWKQNTSTGHYSGATLPGCTKAVQIVDK